MTTSGTASGTPYCGHDLCIQLLKSQDRDTNNPGAQMDMGPEEILLLISRNPEQTRARLEAVRAQREAEAKQKIAMEASKLLRAINARFRNAERTRDTVEAARLRGEAEERLKHLARVSPDAWPWAEQAVLVRERPVLVPDGGGPVYEGLRVGIPSAWSADRVEYAEFGRVGKDGRIGVRSAGEATWTWVGADDARLASLRPQHVGVAFPDDEVEATVRAVRTLAERRLSHQDWTTLGWAAAPDPWLSRVWPEVAGDVLGAMAQASYYVAQGQHVPVDDRGALRLVKAADARRLPGVPVLPPTEGGWLRFLDLAPASGLKFTDLAEAGRWWWGRSVPRTLLSEGADEEGDEEAA